MSSYSKLHYFWNNPMKYNAHGEEMEMEPTFSLMLREYWLSSVVLWQFIFFMFSCVSELCPDDKESTEWDEEKQQYLY